MLGSIVVLTRETKARLVAQFREIVISREILLRIMADLILVNFALAVALAVRCLWRLGIEGSSEPAATVVWSCIDTYLGYFGIVTVTSLAVFPLSGLYTRGRAYRLRYKMVVIAQAVSVTYLLFALGVLLLRDVMSFARSALFLAWLLTMAFMMGARLYVAMWRSAADDEHQLEPKTGTARQRPCILIIGGAGYIGSALTGRLLELGYRVRILDLLLYGDEPIQHFYAHPNFELIQGDLRHIDTVVQAAKGADSIVHLGAIVGDPACQLCGDLTVEINLRATRTIAEIGKGFGVRRFIFASTCSVYGASDEILDERSALNPISLYARTKVESEKVLLGLADASFSPVILRFGTVYGLSGRPRFDLVVNLLTAKAIQDGAVGIVGGLQWRPFVHVKDVAEAIRLALEAPQASVCGQIFNVGSNEQNYRIAEIGTLIGDRVPSARVTKERKEDDRNYRVSFDKIENVLNFRPAFTIPDGITEIIEAFTSGRLKDYRDPRFNNFSFLSQHDELRRALVEDGLIRDGIALSDTDEMTPAGRSQLDAKEARSDRPPRESSESLTYSAATRA
jgi:nucleoside-diphosphate-sugar epimerase